MAILTHVRDVDVENADDAWDSRGNLAMCQLILSSISHEQLTTL